MNKAWADVRASSPDEVTRRDLRGRLKHEPELRLARRGVFGAWRRRGIGSVSGRTDAPPPPEGE